MCNTKNTELIRQQLWCDVYTELIKDVNRLEPSKGANIAVSEFDKAFQVDVEKLDSYIKAKEIKEKELAMKIAAFGKYQRLRDEKDSVSINIKDESELSFIYGDNPYWDVSNLMEKKQGITVYGGVGVNKFDGIETIAYLKSNG